MSAFELASSPAAGGATHTYYGYNTIGGSSGAMTADMHYLKKITLAAAGFLGAISAYVKHNTPANVAVMRAGVWGDSGGSPADMIAVSGVLNMFPQNSSGVAGNARWLAIPVGIYLAAGDYWIGVASHLPTFDLYSDGSGTDVTWTATGDYLSDGGTIFTKTVTSTRYSIRASVLS